MYREYDDVGPYRPVLRRARHDWCGIGIEDAFRGNVEAVIRSTARLLFYDRVRAAQRAAARAAGADTHAWKPSVRPQIAPCYTTFPRRAAAVAAIGMTAYLECMEHASPGLIADTCLADLADLAQLGESSGCGTDAVAAVLRMAGRAVESRLYSHTLARVPGLASIETYRLFLAAQHELRFAELGDIVEAVVLFGDVLPADGLLAMHPTSRLVLRDLTEASRPHFAGLRSLTDDAHLDAGVAWVRDLCRAVLRHLPRQQAGGEEKNTTDAPLALRPLNLPPAPALEESEARKMLPMLAALCRGAGGTTMPESAMDDDTKAVFSTLIRAMKDAGEVADWEDPRPEQVARQLRGASFAAGPFEGDPLAGRLVSVPLGDDAHADGELFESVMEANATQAAADALQDEALPLAQRIRRLLYPNVMPVTEVERIRPSGSLDPTRLAATAFSDAVYRRTATTHTLDERGKPVLVIMADASASLKSREAGMIRLLMAAWLTSVRRRSVQLLCCVYHGGAVHTGNSGSLLRWITHPQKTMGRSSGEAMRALAGFTSGSGAQADALSIRCVIDEANRLAAGRMVYLVVLTDGRWNRCLQTARNGAEEVRDMFARAFADTPQLHVTLVVIGTENPPDAMGCNAIIRVPEADLKSPAAVVENIGLYVATAIRERKRHITK